MLQQWLMCLLSPRLVGRPQASNRATTQEGHSLQGPQVCPQGLDW